MKPDLTEIGMRSLRKAVRMITSGETKRIDLGNGTIVYKISSKNPKKYTIRIDMRIEEEEE